MNEDTQEVPLPEGVARNPDATTTQELPVVEPFPDVRLISPVKVEIPSTRTVRVETVPAHLLGDPILTAPAPVPDSTPLYDQIHGKRERPDPPAPRRKMPTGDKVLVCMGAAALVMGVGVYGMVVNGWGAGPMPEEKTASAPRTAAVPTEEPTEAETLTSAPRPVRSPEKAPVKAVVAPETYTPTPERSIVVVSPTPTPEPETTEPSAEEPTPSPTRTSASPRPSQTPTPSPTTVSPTPTESQSTITIPPPVTQSQSLSASPTEESTDG